MNYMLTSNTLSSADTPLHIIDHGSVMYLIVLQIRFYDQQDSLPLLVINNDENDMNNTDEMTHGVMEIAISYDSNHNSLSFNLSVI